MASAVFTGTVDFSTTILLFVDTDAIMRAAPSLLDVDMHTFGFVFDWTFELSKIAKSLCWVQAEHAPGNDTHQ